MTYFVRYSSARDFGIDVRYYVDGRDITDDPIVEGLKTKTSKKKRSPGQCSAPLQNKPYHYERTVRYRVPVGHSAAFNLTCTTRIELRDKSLYNHPGYTHAWIEQLDGQLLFTLSGLKSVMFCSHILHFLINILTCSFLIIYTFWLKF